MHGPPSFARLPSFARRVASNFLQHCKKWMRDGFASSSFSSGFFYKSQGFQDGAPNTPSIVRGKGAEALFILFGGAARTQPRQGFARNDANQDGPAAEERKGKREEEGVAKKSQEKRAPGKERGAAAGESNFLGGLM